MNADTLKNIGMALSGLSAGIQGRGAEFANSMAAQQQAEETRRQKLSMERQQAMAIDARVVRDHLENALNPDGTVRDQKRLELAMQLAKNRERKIAELGGDPSDTQAFVSALEQDPMQALNLVRGFDTTAQEQGLVSKYEPPKTPQAETVKGADISNGFVVEKMPDGSFRKTKVLEKSEATPGSASAVTKIFGDGTTVQALPSGAVEVKNPEGNTVTGKERLEVLRQARENEIQQEQTKSGAKTAGSQAIEMSGKAFDKIEGIRDSIYNIDEAIRLIDSGASTGTIMSKLPSITSASKQLDNVQKRMGLDVIRNTTFGALSEAELDFALNSALPINLDGPDLRDWLVRKKNAQEKLASYLQDVSVYLGTPGNTVAGWADAQKALQSMKDEPVEDKRFEGFSIER